MDWGMGNGVEKIQKPTRTVVVRNCMQVFCKCLVCLTDNGACLCLTLARYVLRHHLLTSQPRARDRQRDVLEMFLVALTHIAGQTVIEDTWIWFKARPWRGLILACTVYSVLNLSFFSWCILLLLLYCSWFIYSSIWGQGLLFLALTPKEYQRFANEMLYALHGLLALFE